METTKKDKIRFELKETNFLTRWPCDICGGCTEKVPILCEVVTGPYEGLRICEYCLEAGGEEVNMRLKYYIRTLEQRVYELKSMEGRLDFPKYAEWKAAYDEHERLVLEDYKKTYGHEYEPAVASGNDDLPF